MPDIVQRAIKGCACVHVCVCFKQSAHSLVQLPISVLITALAGYPILTKAERNKKQ